VAAPAAWQIAMYLQASKKHKKRQKAIAVLQPKCKYGRACMRKDCIYNHDIDEDADRGGPQNQVCMAFLAGGCVARLVVLLLNRR
jgi:hypothetical protein